MIGGIGIGPETLWQHEMRKLSRAALLHVVSILLFTRSYFGLAMNQDELLKLIRDAKKAGRFDNMIARWDRMEANPHAEYETHLRRRRSAKAAANRRKAAARRAAGEAPPVRITDKTIDELIRMLTMKSTDRRSSTFQRGIAQEVVWALTELKEIRDRKESIPCKGTVS